MDIIDDYAGYRDRDEETFRRRFRSGDPNRPESAEAEIAHTVRARRKPVVSREDGRPTIDRLGEDSGPEGRQRVSPGPTARGSGGTPRPMTSPIGATSRGADRAVPKMSPVPVP